MKADENLDLQIPVLLPTAALYLEFYFNSVYGEGICFNIVYQNLYQII